MAEQPLPKTTVPLKATYKTLASIAPPADYRLRKKKREKEKKKRKSTSIFPGHLLRQMLRTLENFSKLNNVF